MRRHDNNCWDNSKMAIKVKICCIASAGEARLALAHGADAIGLVGEMPSGPGVIDDATIRAIAAEVPDTAASFLLTSRTEPSAIADHVRATGTDTVQIVDWIGVGACHELRRRLDGIDIVQVVHVSGREALGQAEAIQPYVDAILLDSGKPNRAVKELGGTGRVHDWELSAQIVATVERPVYLAGGLGPANVADAIRLVRPHGVDLCSGVRRDGRLDASLLAAFLAAVRSVEPGPPPPTSP